jgi:flagellar hook protein FlgE
MFTAINGLFVQQNFMDVVADNLANVNTPGFKSSTLSFKDQFAQTMRSGAAPTGLMGGVNPTQIGLGVNVGTISPVFTQGALQNTGRALDLAVQGDGFFIYRDDMRQYFSREGALAMDAEGFLVNSGNGNRIQGWMAAAGVISPTANLVGLQIPIDNTVASLTENASLMGNLASTAQPYNGPPAPPAIPLPGNYPFTFTTVTDVLGYAFPTGDSYTVSMGVYDSLGTLQQVNIKWFRETSDVAAGGSLWRWVAVPPPVGADPSMCPQVLGQGMAVFNANGQYDAAATAVAVTAGPALTDPAVPDPLMHVQVYPADMNKLQVLASPGAGTPYDVNINSSGLTMLAAAFSGALSTQDGLAAGNLVNFNVSSNTGELFGVYSNGEQRLIGQLAMALFANPAGLMREGGNRFSSGLNSGVPRIAPAGSGGRGKVNSGYLEGSNVDISREFANMIMAQRGFQANSRIITTSDQMLQELVNLKQ